MFNDKPIRLREGDGYSDATAMCKAVGKQWSAYIRTQPAKEFVGSLATSLNISWDILIPSVTKGLNATRGTWIHSQLGFAPAQWCSPAFTVFVSSWVLELMTTGKVELKPMHEVADIAEPEPSLLGVLNKQTQQTKASGRS
jgi:hypothetical protein